MPDMRISKKKLSESKPEGRCRRRRPIKRWIDGIEDSIKEMGIRNRRRKGNGKVELAKINEGGLGLL